LARADDELLRRLGENAGCLIGRDALRRSAIRSGGRTRRPLRFGARVQRVRHLAKRVRFGGSCSPHDSRSVGAALRRGCYTGGALRRIRNDEASAEANRVVERCAGRSTLRRRHERVPWGVVSSGRRFGGAPRPGMHVGEACRFGGKSSWRAKRCSANLALRRWRERAKRRVRQPEASVSVASQRKTVRTIRFRFGGSERTGWVNGFVQRQEGSGAGDGVQLCEGSKALKGKTP
jgi:hypothetical protein